MSDFKYLSEEYNLKNTNNYRLSIQLNQDGFSVLVANEDKKILKIYHKNCPNPSAISNELKDNPFLHEITKLRYKKTRILVNNCSYSFVPETFFDSKTSLSFFKLEQNLSDSGTIYNHVLNFESINLIFDSSAYSSSIKMFLNAPEIIHICEPHLKYVKKNLDSGNAVILYQGGKTLHISCFINGKLNTCNAFEIGSVKDFHYYSYAFLKNNFIEHGNMPVFYSGMISDSAIRSCEFDEFTTEIKSLPNEMPFELAGFEYENYFTNLLVSSDCVL